MGVALFVGIHVAAQERSKAELDASARARQTVADSVSMPLERIKVLTVAPMQWRDSSLGCPERGMVYTPALVSGYAVKVHDGEREHVVHVAGGRAVICSSRTDSKQRPATIAASLKSADAVRSALAARLGIEPARVRIASTRPFQSSQPCQGAPTQPSATALLVEAMVAEQAFRYYADDTRVVSCDDPGGKQP